MMIGNTFTDRIAALDALKQAFDRRIHKPTIRKMIVSEMAGTILLFRSINQLGCLADTTQPIIYRLGARNSCYALLDIIRGRVLAWTVSPRMAGATVEDYLLQVDALERDVRKAIQTLFPVLKFTDPETTRMVQWIDQQCKTNQLPDVMAMLKVYRQFYPVWKGATDVKVIGHRQFCLSFLRDYVEWLTVQQVCHTPAQTHLVCAELITIITATLNDLEPKE